MKKEDILAASRKENKNMDLAELETNRYAWSIAGNVGAMMCVLVSLLASLIARRMLYSPRVIFFSMMGTSWLVRAIRLKRKSDWLLAAMFVILAGLALVGLIRRLLEVAP